MKQKKTGGTKTQKDTSRTMQMKSNAPDDNQSKGTKKGRQKEVNFSQGNCLPKNKESEKIKAPRTRAKSPPPLV
jgi:hypothetical protein